MWRFLLVGLLLYLGIYAGAESLVHHRTRRNPFFVIATSSLPRYDYVILGTSHAAVLGYRDMNERLEAMVPARVANVAVVGGGISVNTLLLEYMTARRKIDAAVYVVDSFPFYSERWNEERLKDSRLYARAPFDPRLAGLLLRRPYALAAAVDYVSGFSKINNDDRFATDVPSDEGARFERSYRPIEQIDRERLAYLYPPRVDQEVFDRYVTQFDALLERAHGAGVRVIVVKPPLPERLLHVLPGEAAFDARLAGLLASRGLTLHDFSRAVREDAFFFDTDHLNQEGVLRFFQGSLAPLLRSSMPGRAGTAEPGEHARHP